MKVVFSRGHIKSVVISEALLLLITDGLGPKAAKEAAKKLLMAGVSRVAQLFLYP